MTLDIRDLLLAGFTTILLCAASATASPHEISLRFDYRGVEALQDAVNKPSLSDAEIEELFEVHGLAATVDNVHRFIPNVTREHFKEDLKAFLLTREEPRHDGYRVWGFAQVVDTREEVTALIRELRSRESEIADEALSPFTDYSPRTGSREVTVYFVVGGVSDGFVPERSEKPALYVNLVRAKGDLSGVISNLSHEVYHVLQSLAARGAGLATLVESPEKVSTVERLAAVTLWEGSANYATDPRRLSGQGPYLKMWRDRFDRNTQPEQLAKHFALFDEVAKDLRAGRIDWEEAYKQGFTGQDSPFYFVGYEMTRAIDELCGPTCVTSLFEQHPREFFRRYIELYRTHPRLSNRFAAQTEEALGIESAGATSGPKLNLTAEQ